MLKLSTYFVMGAVVWASILLVQVKGIPDNLYLGGLFDSTDPAFESAFSFSLRTVEKNPKFHLARSHFSQVPTNSGNAEFVPPNDSFAASKKVCQIVKNEALVAIIGPQSENSADYVQSMCETLKIPHIQTHWDPDRLSETLNSSESQSTLSVNIYPDSESISQAYFDVITGWDWKVFTILYEDEDGLIRLQYLLELLDTPGYNITIRKLIPNNYRKILKEMKKMKENNIVLDCSQLNCISELLEQAQQVRMTTGAQSYFITSLDMHLLNYDQYEKSDVKITGLRMFDLSTTNTIEMVNSWSDWAEPNPQSLTLEAALVYDSVQMLAKALNDMSRSQKVTPKKLTCYGNDSWKQGPKLVEFIKSTEYEGLTGTIKLDSEGSRTDFELDVIELDDSGFDVVGIWDTENGLNQSIRFLSEKPNPKNEGNLVGKTLLVSTILNKPYLMLKDNYKELYGNERFEGFVFDIIDEISAMLGFNYEFKLVADSKYGILNEETGEWNGMIGEILTGRADIAVADLSISQSRESVVDFTMPFLNTGISILYKKPMIEEEPKYSYFFFLSPLSIEIWMYMAAAYLVVSLAIYVISRITPYEWNSPHPCRQQPDILENNFTLLNSLWFPIGSLMHLRNDIMPRALSTRLIAGLWWFFSLMMISFYLAYLSAHFVTAKAEDNDQDLPISSVEDLAYQSEISYGTVFAGSSGHVFRDSSNPAYRRMWNHMESDTSNSFVRTVKDGVERVQKSNGTYAFLMESTSIDYFIARDCDLIQIGGLIDSKGYGIAMKEGSPFLPKFNHAILEMQQNDRFSILKKKWWQNKRDGPPCKNDSDDQESNYDISELFMSKLAGIFIVLAIGCVFSFLIAIGELAWSRMKSP